MTSEVIESRAPGAQIGLGARRFVMNGERFLGRV
jgi:hypothetical protein